MLVIEMTIVEPPYILDFGKVYFDDRKPDFSPEVLADYEAECAEWFGENWSVVQSALSSLESFGILYVDARPSNLDCTGLKISES
ncbi:MAG: hypothetical protein AAF483_18775 [Planctomycetota bacterium]